MAITSPEQGWVLVNDHLCHLLDRDRGELLTATWSGLTHPEDREAEAAALHRLLAGEAGS